MMNENTTTNNGLLNVATMPNGVVVLAHPAIQPHIVRYINGRIQVQPIKSCTPKAAEYITNVAKTAPLVNLSGTVKSDEIVEKLMKEVDEYNTRLAKPDYATVYMPLSCNLQPGDRVILSDWGDAENPGFGDVVFTVQDAPEKLNENGCRLYPLVGVIKTSEKTGRFKSLDLLRDRMECEHDSHCVVCGKGQNDIGSGKRNEKDELSWCKECNDDVCGACDCGHPPESFGA